MGWCNIDKGGGEDLIESTSWWVRRCVRACACGRERGCVGITLEEQLNKQLLPFSSKSNCKCSTISANARQDLRNALTPSSSSFRNFSSISLILVSWLFISTRIDSSAFLSVAFTLSAIWFVCSEVVVFKAMIDELHNFNTSNKFIGLPPNPAEAATVI